jgi:hypothetical protein
MNVRYTEVALRELDDILAFIASNYQRHCSHLKGDCVLWKSESRDGPKAPSGWFNAWACTSLL